MRLDSSWKQLLIQETFNGTVDNSVEIVQNSPDALDSSEKWKKQKLKKIAKKRRSSSSKQ